MNRGAKVAKVVSIKVLKNLWDGVQSSSGVLPMIRSTDNLEIQTGILESTDSTRNCFLHVDNSQATVTYWKSISQNAEKERWLSDHPLICPLSSWAHLPVMAFDPVVIYYWHTKRLYLCLRSFFFAARMMEAEGLDTIETVFQMYELTFCPV